MLNRSVDCYFRSGSQWRTDAVRSKSDSAKKRGLFDVSRDDLYNITCLFIFLIQTFPIINCEQI